MNPPTERFQDRPLDESTNAHPQHFDASGHVIDEGVPQTTVPDTGRAHPETPEGFDPDASVPGASDGYPDPSGDPQEDATTERTVPDTGEADAPDGLFNDQSMPTADGELSDPAPDAGLADEESER